MERKPLQMIQCVNELCKRFELNVELIQTMLLCCLANSHEWTDSKEAFGFWSAGKVFLIQYMPMGIFIQYVQPMICSFTALCY